MANTQVILTEKINGLGAEADVVNVRGGYARNYLIPTGRALEATRPNLRHTEKLKEKRAAREAEELKVAQDFAAKLKKTTIRLELATGQGGKAFGSITSNDISIAIKDQAGIDVDRQIIDLDKPIKTTGEHELTIKFHPEIPGTLTLIVSAKEDESPSEKA